MTYGLGLYVICICLDHHIFVEGGMVNGIRLPMKMHVVLMEDVLDKTIVNVTVNGMVVFVNINTPGFQDYIIVTGCNVDTIFKKIKKRKELKKVLLGSKVRK